MNQVSAVFIILHSSIKVFVTEDYKVMNCILEAACVYTIYPINKLKFIEKFSKK
jgi:hypothetical protein